MKYQNNLEKITNENGKEITIYISKRKTKKDCQSEMNYNSIIMEHQKIINLLENTPNQPSKFRTKNLVWVNDESRRTYNVNNQFKFKASS